MSDEITILPRSRIVRVECEVMVPADATKEEILEWVSFYFGRAGGMEDANPLSRFEPESLREPVLTDTEMHLHEDVVFEEGGCSTIRKWRNPKPFTGERGIDRVLARARTK